ncbi:hypothetical protein JAAARDRAFT_36505 [Jaapia argillacea MUCL 33604]|uniref:Uncharacterized protein n=1 Tax=Jaapia argillacea MUCL 33604 TaxID=933084 RepID=A0A067PNG4_9AGAM|nr:hypothetical protein JAAARDRAFT_36505 [Jaapia argillacea MUCL 33604]
MGQGSGVPGGVLAGIILGAVAFILLVVVIIVPFARKHLAIQRRVSILQRSSTTKHLDLESGTSSIPSHSHSGNGHTRAISGGADPSLPLLPPVSPLFGRSGSLPHSGEKLSEDGHTTESYPSMIRSATTRSQSIGSGISVILDPPSDTSRPHSRQDVPHSHSPSSSDPALLSPPPPYVSGEQSSRNKSRGRIVLPYQPMEPVLEQPDPSSTTSPTSPPLAADNTWWSRRPTVFNRLPSAQPLTGAFRMSLRSDSTAASRSSSGASVIRRYPSITASSATYLTADEQSLSNSPSNLSLSSGGSSRPSMPPISERLTATPDPLGSRRAHLKNAGTPQTPELHQQKQLRSMSRHASLNYMESDSNPS